MAKHILVVDDDALLRRSLSLQLEQAGYRTSTAASAEDALALTRRDKPDLILLDVGLPGMDGAFSYRVGGENTFMPDPSIDERAPGPIGLQSIGGVIKHLGALTSIGSSTVNSYRRLWDTGFCLKTLSLTVSV